ncbi:MAG: SpoVR family protein [Chloroflexota bacterium]
MTAEPTQIEQLEAAFDGIWQSARNFGLDPFPVHFELVPASIMYEFGAYGLPGRFSHWTHGRTYQQIKTMYDYGLSKIYELVINANPAAAFLLENNSVLQNKLVIAHVLGHSDFFKHNAYFERTNRKMLESVRVNAERISQYEFRHGKEEVERFLDAVLCIEEHIDPFSRRGIESTTEIKQPTTQFDDLFYLGNEHRPEMPVPQKKFPVRPEKDLLRFIADHGRELTDWQRDVIEIVRAEQEYFVPQMQTKIMNEGWAAYWHAKIMRELALTDDEFMQFAELHSGVLASSGRSINPYLVGMRMFEEIERTWDSPTDEQQRHGIQPGSGREKMFDVREVESDASFLRNYLSRKLVEDLDLYLYRKEGDRWVIVEKDWHIVRDAIVASMTNFGRPYLVVEDGDYRKNGELYLRHQFEGQELDQRYADMTLRHVEKLWGRTVHLETVVDGHPVVWASDGSLTRLDAA